ncbi:hypothetical protein LXL04_027812 [Taraxacum kok-saghyz]
MDGQDQRGKSTVKYQTFQRIDKKAGYGTFVVDFHISQGTLPRHCRNLWLLVARIDNMETAACIASPSNVNHGRTSAPQSAGTRLKSENLGFPFSVTLLVEKETDRDGGFRLRWRSVVESSREAVANGEGFAVGVRSQGCGRDLEDIGICCGRDLPEVSRYSQQDSELGRSCDGSDGKERATGGRSREEGARTWCSLKSEVDPVCGALPTRLSLSRPHCGDRVKMKAEKIRLFSSRLQQIYILFKRTRHQLLTDSKLDHTYSTASGYDVPFCPHIHLRFLLSIDETTLYLAISFLFNHCGADRFSASLPIPRSRCMISRIEIRIPCEIHRSKFFHLVERLLSVREFFYYGLPLLFFLSIWSSCKRCERKRELEKFGNGRMMG